MLFLFKNPPPDFSICANHSLIHTVHNGVPCCRNKLTHVIQELPGRQIVHASIMAQIKTYRKGKLHLTTGSFLVRAFFGDGNG